MKLSDIVIKEAAPEGDKPIELKDLTEYFPNTYKKAAKTLAKNGRLTWGGAPVFTKSGDYGIALDQAVAEAEELLKDSETVVDVNVELDGSVADIDDGGNYTVDYPLDEFQVVFTGYDSHNDEMLIGFDVWLDEEIFNQDFDKEFERVFGEDFDMDNPDHEKIFDNAHKQFGKHSFMGVLVSVNENGRAKVDMTLPDGFYKGIYNGSALNKKHIIDFALD